MPAYRDDRTWSDGFMPAVRRILGPHLLDFAPIDFDLRQATDLIVLTARDLRIAVRIRRPGFFERYPYQFTIRAERESGAVTEMQKIKQGFAHWLFYGHGDDKTKEVPHWMIIDLHALRLAMIDRIVPPHMTGLTANGDGTSFRWFDVRGFEQCAMPILVASQIFPDNVVALRPPERSAPRELPPAPWPTKDLKQGDLFS